MKTGVDSFSLSSFIATGKLGPLSKGLAEAALTDIVGEPSDVTVSSVDNQSSSLSCFWERGLQITTFEGKIAVLGLYCRYELTLSSFCGYGLQLDIPEWEPPTIGRLERWLRAENLGCRRCDIGDGDASIHVEQGANVYFCNGLLDSVQV